VYLSDKCIRICLPKIVDRISDERGVAPRAGLPKIYYTTIFKNQKVEGLCTNGKLKGNIWWSEYILIRAFLIAKTEILLIKVRLGFF